jgi:hypothetical protein
MHTSSIVVVISTAAPEPGELTLSDLDRILRAHGLSARCGVVRRVDREVIDTTGEVVAEVGAA